MRGSHIRRKARYGPKRGRLSGLIIANQAEESRKIAALLCKIRQGGMSPSHGERGQVASLLRAVSGDELLSVAAWFVGKGHADGAGADERLKVALKGVLS